MAYEVVTLTPTGIAISTPLGFDIITSPFSGRAPVGKWGWGPTGTWNPIDTSTPLPVGDAAVLAELITLLNEATFTTTFGAVGASPAANTVLDRLKTLATLLGAGLPAALGTGLGIKVDMVSRWPGPADTWSYAAPAGGLVTTAGVPAKAAAGSGIRNYIDSYQILNKHATIDTDVIIRDGAGGTELWRFPVSAKDGLTGEFVRPLRGSPNTLIEIAEGTATATNGLYVNLQGHVADS